MSQRICVSDRRMLLVIHCTVWITSKVGGSRLRYLRSRRCCRCLVNDCTGKIAWPIETATTTATASTTTTTAGSTTATATVATHSSSTLLFVLLFQVMQYVFRFPDPSSFFRLLLLCSRMFIKTTVSYQICGQFVSQKWRKKSGVNSG